MRAPAAPGPAVPASATMSVQQQHEDSDSRTRSRIVDSARRGRKRSGSSLAQTPGEVQMVRPVRDKSDPIIDASSMKSDEAGSNHRGGIKKQSRRKQALSQGAVPMESHSLDDTGVAAIASASAPTRTGNGSVERLHPQSGKSAPSKTPRRSTRQATVHSLQANGASEPLYSATLLPAPHASLAPWIIHILAEASQESLLFEFNRPLPGTSSPLHTKAPPPHPSVFLSSSTLANDSAPPSSTSGSASTGTFFSSDSSGSDSSSSRQTTSSWTSARTDITKQQSPKNRSPSCSPRSTSSTLSTASWRSSSSGSSTYFLHGRRVPKRASETNILEQDRLKKRKVSHRIRSFLLLRPPGATRPGVDGAADILEITRAPAWLKNATAQLSRESRMAPQDWQWSGSEADPHNWTISTLERTFADALKLNTTTANLAYAEAQAVAEHEEAQEEERQIQMEAQSRSDTKRQRPGLSRMYGSEPMIAGQLSHMVHGCSSRTSHDGSSDVAPQRGQRQSSAPPMMEGDDRQVDLFEPESKSLHTPRARSVSKPAEDRPPRPPPPEVLKNQLLAVLRSRLPENARAADAPLRMKKFVVWNAWVRRATILTPRRMYTSRSASPPQASSAEVVAEPVNTQVSGSESSIYHPYTDEEQMLAAPQASAAGPAALPVKQNDEEAMMNNARDIANDDFDPFTMFDDDENDDELFNEVEQALHIRLGNSTQGEDTGTLNAPIATPGPEQALVSPPVETSTMLFSPSPMHPTYTNPVFSDGNLQYEHGSQCHPSTASDPQSQTRPTAPLRARLETNAGSTSHSTHQASHESGSQSEFSPSNDNLTPPWLDQAMSGTPDAYTTEPSDESYFAPAKASPSMSPSERRELAAFGKPERSREAGMRTSLLQESVIVSM